MQNDYFIKFHKFNDSQENDKIDHLSVIYQFDILQQNNDILSENHHFNHV